MKVICYGDSNTWGYDPRSYFGGRYDSGWVPILAEKTCWNVINQGENGREIPKTTVSFPDDTDLLIIMLGTNDLLQGAKPEEVTDRMENFLRRLSMDSEKLLLIAPPPMVLGEWVYSREMIADSIFLVQSYQTLAKRLGIRFINAGKWTIALSFDGVHFTEEGHRAFAEGLYKELMNT